MSALANIDDDQFLTTGDFARLVGLSPDAIRKAHREGRVAAIRTASGQRLFRKSDVLVFVEQRRATAYSFGRPQKELKL